MTAEQREYPSLMAMLDDVFFAEEEPEDRRDFLSLLPKLYKERYAPWDNNYIVREGEDLKAAVGLYIADCAVGGEALRCGGIGNVAVAKDSRRKGYMKQAMHAAMAAMREAGCDFGALGGHRHRYQYWGFECGGVKICAEFTRQSVRHACGEVDIGEYKIAQPAREDLPRLLALIERAPMHIKHDPDAFYDTLCSWESRPRIVWRGDEIAAYFALQREGKGMNDSRFMNDFHLFEPAALPGVLNAVIAVLPADVKAFGASIPLWEKEFIAGAERYAEWLHPGDTAQFTILNFERTLRALLALQCGLKELPDGELTVKINGTCEQFAHREETLRLRVKNNQSSVEKYSGAPGIELGHIEAMRFFTGLTSSKRTSYIANAWFPLPLFLYDMDKV